MPVKPKTHKPVARTTPRHHTAQQEARESSTQRGYSYKWQRAARGYLARNPLCVDCVAQGQVKAAAQVDHIIPHRGDMALFWDQGNWQGLCASHHSRKTVREDGGFGRRTVEHMAGGGSISED